MAKRITSIPSDDPGTAGRRAAAKDQAYAQALDKLRGSSSFLLFYGDEAGEWSRAACFDGYEPADVLATLIQLSGSVGRMIENIVLSVESGEWGAD